MVGTYSIATDAGAGLLTVTLAGFFSVEGVSAMRGELQSALSRLGCEPGKHQSLYDISDCKIQSQEVVQILRAMSDAKGMAARRLAVVTGASLMRMQLSRILVDRDVFFCETSEIALRWLFNGRPILGRARTG